MNNPRHLFVLLGFLAQGLTWESYGFVLVVFGLWALAVTVLHRRFNVTLTTEAIALVVGCVISVLLNRLTDRSAHFFLGDGLILLQLVRLMRPLNRREKLTQTVVAAFHFGVVCTLAPNVRFVVLLVAATFLLPGALKEIFMTEMVKSPTAVPMTFPFRIVPSFRVAFWLALGSAFVFITFPRFTGTPLQLREGLTEQGSLLDSILDPRMGGRANSQQVLFQVEGVGVGYMRCFAMPETDGVRWWASRTGLREPFVNQETDLREGRRYLHRRVFVKDSKYLGKVIPVDGKPVFMKQNFFSDVWQSELKGELSTSMMWTTGNNTYEYYVDTSPEADFLRPEAKRLLLHLPPQSRRLTNWLAAVTENATNSYHASKIIEAHLRSNFAYQLGTPELSRLAPVEDFLFHRREGHCERFASTLALLLRMQGVPSRVVVGYVPTTRNFFTGRQQARFRDAHSWTEGYFEDRGWVTFDATPGPPSTGTRSQLWDMLEALDFAWYSHVVNFNGFAQREFFSGSARLFKKVPEGTRKTFIWAMIGLLVTATGIRVWQQWGWKVPAFHLPGRKSSHRAGRGYYDRLLQVLAGKGLTRKPNDTPIEFLETVRANAPDAKPEAEQVTEVFCRTYYGQKPLSEREQRATEEALKRLKEQDAESKV